MTPLIAQIQPDPFEASDAGDDFSLASDAVLLVRQHEACLALITEDGMAAEINRTWHQAWRLRRWFSHFLAKGRTSASVQLAAQLAQTGNRHDG